MAYPIPVVRVIIEDLEERILLLKRTGSIGNGLWNLPGGKVESTTIEEAARKEVKEETGLEIDDLRFLFYQDSLAGSKGEQGYIHFYFSARYNEGNITLNGESTEGR